ncbi:ligand-dependent corepressor isoform X2 [Corythoichthys intestinalis]|uniref:ligand-dependent corepressor isoform X2 n=1 Tax=Corythoichthys intestinalis TaxID=161448 RepID=UPI0025A54F26|nr:ligand-dependent corepressor isoform X2 [Corythoichthys intestinalis]XP_061792501.1 ligand-dependent corepressor-like [Nerophis lumbriciformis]
MASLCKRQQCTIERRGFRQELDSWRHKLIHCVGFESILEGLFGPGVVKDSTLFQDCEPEEVADWSFDDNCLFCCLRREKVKDHSADDTVADVQLLSEGEDAKREQTRLSRLERQAQDFLNAVFHRKDLPSLSDPHIPLVAREIMQRMIRQFAAEYTSKSTQDACPPPLPPNGAMKDQSLPPCSPPPPTPGPPPGSPPSSASCSSPSPCLSPPNTEGGATTAAASTQNPVLSKLLMADQDGPLDLTVKKSPAETETPVQQDGVLDLSTKKNQSDKQGFSSPHGLKGRPVKMDASIKVDRSMPDADEDDVMLPQSFQDGLRENLISSFKPPLARSLRIKEELLSQKHRLLSQPAALSLASLESAGLLNHGQSHSLLGQKGSSSFWGSKAHLESLIKLKQASGALSGTFGDLKDLPKFLENHHNHHGAFSFKSSLLHHHNQVSKAQHHHHDAKRDHSPPVDLKIPQVRGMDLSWDSPASDLYGYGGIGPGGGGGLSENTLNRKLRAILPKQNRRGGSLGSLLDGAAEYWTADLEHSASGPAYSTSDMEGDPNSKQPRKKRGRYRQYNSEILEEAIAVVMSGKMSVSKAQNMYGIPHSTLEYKVKERMGTLKNPPKKKLKLMMKMETGGPEFPGDTENTPAVTLSNVACGAAPPSLGPAELKVDVKEEMEPID